MAFPQWTDNSEAKRLLRQLVSNPDHLRATTRGPTFSEGLTDLSRVRTYRDNTDFADAAIRRLWEIVHHHCDAVSQAEEYAPAWWAVFNDQPTVDQAIAARFEAKARRLAA